MAASLALGPSLACARRLPDYAMPRVEIVDPAKLPVADGIRYRKLKPSDFHAKTPPIEDKSHAEQMGAYTCARVATLGEMIVTFTRDANGRYVAHSKPVAVAEMDRNCSWWNPQQSKESAPYILQHEQIHFAISEIAARQFTARAARLTATGDTPEQAAAALRREFESAFRDTMEHMTERNLEFDRDTSGRRNVALQQQWFDHVNAELAH